MISIVIPVYNAEIHIKQCIDSIRQQTFSHWNLILVDDGSTDKSSRLCDEYAQKDSRIHVIHQENRGAVEARRTGVLSPEAQNNPYIVMGDADDTMPADALDRLYRAAQEYNADLVCGRMRKMWKGILLPERWTPPCFQIESPAVYTNHDIIQELFISYFGISNFPVSLWGKLYKTELLTKAIDVPPVVRFMGEDLSITIRILPETEKLVIVPDMVYYYRIGGGTSQFMPYLMDDFVSLYRYKQEFAEKHSMPQDASYLMSVELMNMTKTHFMQYMKQKHLSRKDVENEIWKTCKIDVVCDAAESLLMLGKDISNYARFIYEGNVEGIYDEIGKIIRKQRTKDYLKSIMKKL